MRFNRPAKRSYDHYSGGAFKRRLIRIYLPAIIVGLAMLIYPVVLPSAATAAANRAAHPTAVLGNHTFTQSTGTNPVTSSAAAALTAIPAPPTCKPDTQFQPAGAFTSNAGQTGLVELTDTPYRHVMYGYTAEQMRTLGLDCPLVVAGEHETYINAYTTYWLNWQYSYSQGEDNLCRVSGAKVLLHIRQALPDWQKPGGADPSLTSAWQAYVSAVTTHEAGHVQLDQTYASQLLNSLQNFPASPCGTITQSVNDMGYSYINQLDQANAAYDSATHHGELQGAIVP